ncbi:uncharacterized protein LOC134834886 [Culicoides brevitarsis]|uniref:uncharacterized protein LOC134834886 n=1 Tax=Culicoides brevitarsis TaxID=469753 RepID=UPI00307C479F
MYFATIFLLTTAIVLLSTGDVAAKRNPSLPRYCTSPNLKQRSKCKKEPGFAYIQQKNICQEVSATTRGGLCLGRGGFTTLDECVYKCYDYRKMFDKRNVDGCNNPITEEEMSEPIRVVSRGDAPDDVKDNRCREPTQLGVQKGSGRTTKSPTYKFNKDTNQCVEAKDNVCLGRNRFQSKEECVHVCNWNLSSGRHRYIVRADNAKKH